MNTKIKNYIAQNLAPLIRLQVATRIHPSITDNVKYAVINAMAEDFNVIDLNRILMDGVYIGSTMRRDWANNFMSVNGYAEYYSLSNHAAKAHIDMLVKTYDFDNRLLPLTFGSTDISPANETLFNNCKGYKPPKWHDYDGFEIAPCTHIGSGVVEQATHAWEIDFWTVYGHLKTGGLDSITDVSTLNLAKQVVEVLHVRSGLPLVYVDGAGRDQP